MINCICNTKSPTPMDSFTCTTYANAKPHLGGIFPFEKIDVVLFIKRHFDDALHIKGVYLNILTIGTKNLINL